MKAEAVKRWLVLLVGIPIALLVIVIRIIGRSRVVGVRVKGLNLNNVFPTLKGFLPCPRKQGLVIYFRHVSFWEAPLLPFLLFPFWLLGERYVPLSVIADYWLARFPWIGPVCIVVPKEGSARQALQTLKQIKVRLDDGQIIMLAPTGTRQYHSQDFRVLWKQQFWTVKLPPRVSYADLLEGYQHKVVGKFQSGIGWLAENCPDCYFMPVWVKTKFLWSEYVFGKPFQVPSGLGRKELAEYLENKLLLLGEKY